MNYRNFYSQNAENTNKKSSLLFSNRLHFEKSNKFFIANYRSPAGFHPAGHHQLPVFRLGGSSILRSICFMMTILNKLSLLLSSKI